MKNQKKKKDITPSNSPKKNQKIQQNSPPSKSPIKTKKQEEVPVIKVEKVEQIVVERKQEKTQKKRRNCAWEYLISFLIVTAFEQFVFHQWRIYTYFIARQDDLGVYDKVNIPITRHNEKLFTMFRTEINFSDFAEFIQVDVKDAYRDKDLMLTKEEYENLKEITNETSFSRYELRKYLARYLPERIKWTGIHPVHNDTGTRDTHRYYWASKMAKDFIIFTNKTSFTNEEVQSFFTDRVILNYLNEMLLQAMKIFHDVVVQYGGIKKEYFDEMVPPTARNISKLFEAKRSQIFINLDNIYYQFAQIIQTNKTYIFKEELGNYTDFRTDPYYYLPILPPQNFTMDYFRSPEDPYLIDEQSYDDPEFRLDRRVRRSYLTRDLGKGDQRLKYQYVQTDINSTAIMRGFHITVRHFNGTLITDEYGPTGPFKDSRKKAGKVLWYRPRDYLHPNYYEGEEWFNTYKMPRKPTFNLSHYEDKRAIWFQRIKKSNFLPRCIREILVTKELLTHDYARCHAGDHEPVFDDFYNILGIEKNKDYFFEYMSVW